MRLIDQHIRNSMAKRKWLICKFCHETLEDPIILPCGKTIWSKHLLNEINNFKCNLCENSHNKSVDKFPVNEELNELVLMNTSIWNQLIWVQSSN